MSASVRSSLAFPEGFTRGATPTLDVLRNSSTAGLQRLPQTLESWFGSIEAFESNLVQVSRVAIVDCLTYPFIAFSHQCQFYPYYTVVPSVISPLRTLVVLNNIANAQSLSALWRGWRPHLFLLMVKPFLTAVLTKLLGSGTIMSPRHWVQTLLANSLPHLLVMPLLSFKYAEILQTTRDKPGSDVLTDILDRPWFREDELRRIPFLLLATPTLLHGLLSSMASHGIRGLLQRVLHTHTPPSSPHTLYTSAISALWVDYLSLLLSDVLLYPLETVLVRLYCQGMPALVDDIQTGTGVTYVSTYNTGLLDCLSGVWENEGALGFFKGFSSLLIRYAIHGLVLVVLWRTARALDNRFKTR